MDELRNRIRGLIEVGQLLRTLMNDADPKVAALATIYIRFMHQDGANLDPVKTLAANTGATTENRLAAIHALGAYLVSNAGRR